MASNMKAVKLRIKSVQSTMQICKAMELVAASRLHKAMERAENSRPYFEALQGTLAQIAAENIDMMSIYTKEPQNDDWCFIVIAGDRGFAGGLIGYATGNAVIENSYAVVDMDVDHGTAIGGLVGHGNSGSVTISNSYATGEALTKAYVTSSAAGISNNGSISNSVSIFPEMTSLNRIGVA